MLVAVVSAARIAKDADLNSNMVAEGRTEDGGDLNVDQYILAWNDPFGSIQMTPYTENKGWEFVVPAICRDTGAWVKVNKHMGALKGTHCTLVTCEVAGSVKATALDDCPKNTFTTDIWEKDKPARVLDSNDAHVAINGYVFQGPRHGAPPQSGHRNSLMALSKTTPTEIGWEFSMSDFKSATPKFKEWDARSPNCRDRLALWSDYGIVPKDNSSLTECKNKRNEKVSNCQAEWKTKSETQTAWEWKEMMSKANPSIDMEGVRKVFPDCTGWCDKESCMVTPVPADVKRDEKRSFKILQSKKRDCEDELDKYAEKHMRKCENADTFCFALWEDLRPCAMTYGLPREPRQL